MLFPNIVGLALFIFVPMIMAIYISFFQWDAISPMKFVGFKNYITMLSDEVWWKAVITTVKYTAMYVIMVFCTSLCIAVFLESIPGKKMQNLLRTVYFVPYTISTVVLAIIWLFILDPVKGLMNRFIEIFHIPSQVYLGDPNQALFWIAFMTAWVFVGYYAILFLAAIKDIPDMYYDAAKIDGANALQIFRMITFPMIKEIRVFVLVVTTIASFHVFDQINILTKGGPVGSTNVAVFYIFTNGFQYLKLGYSAALSFVLFFIIFIFSVVFLKITKGRSHEL
jgi:multiple sugar transport system permease protein